MADHGTRAALATNAHGVTFTFVAARPLRSVAVAGTFTSWRGDWSLLREVDAGRWQTTLPLSSGRHLSA